MNLSSKELNPSLSWLNFKPSGQTKSIVVPIIGLKFSSRSDADHTSVGTTGFNDDIFLQFDGPIKKENVRGKGFFKTF